MVTQGLVLGLLLFNIFINEIEAGISGNIFIFIDNTKSSREIATLQEVLQADVDRTR